MAGKKGQEPQKSEEQKPDGETPPTSPQAPESGQDITALQAQLKAAEEKAAQAVKDAAKARERLREFESTLRKKLEMEAPQQDAQTPWEERFKALMEGMEERINAQVGEIQKRLNAAEEAKQQAELQALRAKIGAEMGLPPALVNRLQGETEQAIRQDAEALKQAMPQGTFVSPMNPAGDDKSQTSALAERLYKRRQPFAIQEIFTPEGNESMGGGVSGTSGDNKQK